MGISCSRDGTFQLVPYLESVKKQLKKTIGSTSQPEKVYEWLQQIRYFPTVEYDERLIASSGMIRASVILKIGHQQVCQWKSDKSLDKAFLLEIHTNVCKSFLDEDYIKSLLADKEYYMVLSVVVPKTTAMLADIVPHISHISHSTNPKKRRYLKSAPVCATIPIEKIGVSIAFYYILSYANFIKEQRVVNSLNLLAQSRFESPPIINNVCYISLLCSNNNGGATLLNYIKDCKRKPTFEMYALNAIPSSYSYYLLYGFKRSNNQRDFFPIWYDKNNNIYYYDIESMPPEEFDNVKSVLQDPKNINILEPLRVFYKEGFASGYLLTRLIASNVAASAPSATSSASAP